MNSHETGSESTEEPIGKPPAPETPQQSERIAWEWWNMLSLSLHHVMLRLAWIFKTETVIMPAFLDVIAGAGWIRGCLPVLNRISQSVAPVLFSARLRNAPRKTVLLMQSSFLMSALFGALAAFCSQLGSVEMPWLPAAFLMIYALFFASTGVNQMCFNTVQGKLIRAHHRGRLMSIAGMAGSLVAMVGAWCFLTGWLAVPDGRGFMWIFGFTSACFLGAGLLISLVHEPPDEPGHSESHPLRLFQNVARTLKTDQTLQRVAFVAALFISTLLLFPHYQWLGRTRLGAGAADLMIWVIVQNLSVGIFSWLAGYCGDRYGYRIVIRCEMFALAMVPVIALSLAYSLTPETRGWYAFTFWLLGLTPVTIKTMFNYVLELVDEEHHPHYFSTLNICMALPLFFSPVVGWLVDWNTTLVFSAISLIVFSAALLTFRMHEPRDAGEKPAH